MSIHKSLRKVGALKRHRNVFTRAERLKILTDDGKATEESSVFGLVKVRSILVKAKPKPKAAVAGAEGAAAAPAAGAAAPPAGAAPAAAAGAKPAAGAAAAKPAAGAPAKK
jgi:small basic protein (TIGR04137 family)